MTQQSRFFFHADFSIQMLKRGGINKLELSEFYDADCDIVTHLGALAGENYKEMSRFEIKILVLGL